MDKYNCPRKDCPIKDQALRDADTLYKMSHDLAGPVATLQGLSALLDKQYGDATGEIREKLNDVVNLIHCHVDELEKTSKLITRITVNIESESKKIKEILTKNLG